MSPCSSGTAAGGHRSTARKTRWSCQQRSPRFRHRWWSNSGRAVALCSRSGRAGMSRWFCSKGRPTGWLGVGFSPWPGSSGCTASTASHPNPDDKAVGHAQRAIDHRGSESHCDRNEHFVRHAPSHFPSAVRPSWTRWEILRRPTPGPRTVLNAGQMEHARGHRLHQADTSAYRGAMASI